MKETPGQIFAVVKWNMVWKTPSVHNHAKVKVSVYFRAQLITLHSTETTKVSWNLFSTLNYFPLCFDSVVLEYLSPESKSLKVTEPTAKWKGKQKLIEYQMKEGRKEIKTWESRPSTGLNYLSLLCISHNKHVIPGCWSPWYWGPRSPNKIIVRFSGWTKGLMLLLIGYKTGGRFWFKSSIWKL